MFCFMDYLKLLIEALTLHDTIERMDLSSHWSGCKCDHGCDGRMPRQGPKCQRCLADERLREIKTLIDFDKQKREAKAKSDAMDSAQL